MPGPELAVRLGLGAGNDADELIDGLKQQLPVTHPEDVCQTLAQVVPNHAGRLRRGEVDDLEDLLFEVELLGVAVVDGEALDVLREGRYEGQEEEVLLFCGERL